MGAECRSQKAKLSKDTDFIWRVLAARRESDSSLTRNAAVKAEQELKDMIAGSAFERLVAWYFSNVCSGYGYVIRTEDELRSRSGWITPKQLMTHLGGYNEPKYLGIRPSNRHTNWAAIDIDIQSRYHPASEEGEGIEPVLDAMRSIGMTSGLEFQSSYSEGIHIWFPLARPTVTWQLAIAMDTACRRNGLEVRNGVLELRPNRKGYGSQYLAIRAPFTGEGNALWIAKYDLVEELDVLRLKWSDAQASNALIWDPSQKATTEICSSNRRGQVERKNRLLESQERLRLGFTSTGQTQEIKLAALQIARLIEGIEDEGELLTRTCTLIREAPGFSEHCRHKSAILNLRYVTRGELRKALRMTPGGYKNTWKEQANEKRATDAKARAMDVMAEIERNSISFTSMTEAFAYIKAHFGPTKSWWHKSENHTLLEQLRSRTAGQKSIHDHMQQ